MKFKKLISLLISAFMLFSSTACSITEDGIEQAIDIISEVDEYLSDDTLYADETSAEETTATTEETTAYEQTASEQTTVTEEQTTAAELPEPVIDENGSYTSKDDVALYIHTYGRLPDNFITKKEAQALGWEGGSLERYAPGMCIGGSYFGNYEGLLPEKDGRKYTECDIDTLGKKSRGAKRIVFSNDGLIYYTDDHYETFELLYGEE